MNTITGCSILVASINTFTYTSARGVLLESAMHKKIIGVFAAIVAVASSASPGFQTALTEKAFGYST